MNEFEKLLMQYEYVLPEELIAQEPATPRDSARLMIYDRATHSSTDDIFLNLQAYLPKNAVLVFNKTRVIPARLFVHKISGGHVELLYLRTIRGLFEMLANRKLSVGMRLVLTAKKIFIVQSCGAEGIYIIKPEFVISDVHKFFITHGHTPIPPYIKHLTRSEGALRRDYQTVFARQFGSVAAPTASLHFTRRLLKKIRDSGCSIRFVILHVGLGTFAPLHAEHIARAKLHEEQYHIDQSTAMFLNQAKRGRRPIIAVGTTVTRTLESASDERGILERLNGSTDLFIREPYRFKFINSMITNFHVPKSSLLMLVAAFVGRGKLFKLYEQAIQERFRFFSFGDGMFIL